MEFLDDKELSWEAKGLLTYIVNQSGAFVLNKKFFYSNFSGGRRKIESIFKELQNKGYLNAGVGVVQNVQSVVDNVQQVNVQNVQQDVQNVQQNVQNVPLLNIDTNTPYSPPQKIKTNKPKQPMKIDEVKKSLERWVEEDEELQEAVNDFYQHRKEQGDKITDRSKKMFLKRLQTLSHGNAALATKLVEYSILRNWKTVYEHKFDDTPSEFVQKQKNSDRL